jgi:hypothetical protein
VVEVQAGHTEGTPRSLGTVDHHLERRVDAAAVHQTGERVVSCVVLRLGAEPPERREQRDENDAGGEQGQDDR